ncbi:MAG: pyridoxal-phosphate dependent enzyme, partial [Thermoanaerobaculia bacterium]
VVRGLREGGHGAAVWGAEPLLSNVAARSLRAGRRLENETESDTLADGARTLSLGERNWEILRGGLAGIVEVDEPAIRDGLRLLSELANLKAEPTGALALGALLTDPGRFRDRRIACVVSGGNVDPAAYAALLRPPLD